MSLNHKILLTLNIKNNTYTFELACVFSKVIEMKMLFLIICSSLNIPCIITFQLLADLENSSMFTGDLECQKLLMEAMKYHLLPERRPMMQSPRTKPRKSTVGALYAVGGMDAMKGNRKKVITL